MTWRLRHLVLVVSALTLVLAVATHAQRGGGAAPTVTLVPVAASSLLLRPEAYLNETVSVFGTVEQSLSGTAFSMDQDAKKAALTDLLIIAPTLTAQPAPGTYMTVVGVVIRFDQAEIQKRETAYALDLPPNVAERYRGQVMVLATSVVDPNMVDLAKAPPVPMTPAEEAFDQVMKQVNPTAAALRNGVTAADIEVVKKEAPALGKLFDDARKFFETRGTTDAVAWAAEGVALAKAIEKDGSDNRWSDVRASTTKLTALCQSCHSAHRERGPDGTFRVKK